MKTYWSLVFVFFFILLAGCEDDRTVTKLQYMPDMADGPVAKFHRSHLKPPEHSVAYKAIIYPQSAEEAERLLANPFAKKKNRDQLVKRGGELYQKMCSHCHGARGEGDGPVAAKFVRPPNLLDQKYKDKKDGFFFHTITFGSAIMPAQGGSTDPSERWLITMYLRELQESADESQ